MDLLNKSSLFLEKHILNLAFVLNARGNVLTPKDVSR